MQQTVQAPLISRENPVEIAPGVHVIPDNDVPLVPNVGIVVGKRAALVIDTGLGPENGSRVRKAARTLTENPVLLTLTHFHPEHGFGAQAFHDATIVYNRAQAEELAEKGAALRDLFRDRGGPVAEYVSEVELTAPDIAYDRAATIDLGGRHVELSDRGPAHTRGDQVVFLEEERVLFTGDLVEGGAFPIFSPGDTDASGDRWIRLLEELERLAPVIVVPGHGEVGDAELLRATRRCLEDVRRSVFEAGNDMSLSRRAELETELRERHSSLRGLTWIGSAVDAFLRETVDGP